MDILRKMFNSTTYNDVEKMKEPEVDSGPKNEFRKPQWFEEVETDDELFDDDRKFAFQIFTNPLELQKQFEHQFKQVLEAVREYEGTDLPMDKSLKDEFLKPGFEHNGNLFKDLHSHSKTFMDTDLDGEIFSDELHSLIQGLHNKNHETLPNMLPRNDKSKNLGGRFVKPKLSDEDYILGLIHGTLPLNENQSITPRAERNRPEMMTPMTPLLPPNGNGGGGSGGAGVTNPFGGGVFEGIYQGPKMFSQSVMMKTIRKPDGSMQTTKVTQDSQGNRTTTVTRTVGGKTETITNYGGVTKRDGVKQPTEAVPYSDRNLYVTKEGYAMPRNLW